MSDWQPIETAPKDERRILAYEDGQIYICSRRLGYDWWSSEHDDKGAGKPTHWMPLPDPPQRCPFGAGTQTGAVVDGWWPCSCGAEHAVREARLEAMCVV